MRMVPARVTHGARGALRRRIPIPIVFMSAQIDADIRRELIARGAVDCLFKPFGGEALLEAVGLAIQGR